MQLSESGNNPHAHQPTQQVLPLYNGTLLADTEEQGSVPCYNMDDPQSISQMKEARHKHVFVCSHVDMSRESRPVETEIRLGISWVWEWE